jgi:hypothetical protein
MKSRPNSTAHLPSRREALVFLGKSRLLQVKRTVADRLGPPLQRHLAPTAAPAPAIPVLSESITPLWPTANPAELDLTAGKVQNLRIACRRLDGVEVAAGTIFSFWKQVGRVTRRKGYVPGRELREGCLVANIGGGLCQLSNALYDAALKAGFEIVERHAHTKVIPGSLAEQGRDATVYWNYVDLRFRSDHDFRIEARLSKDHLSVRFKGARRSGQTDPQASPLAPGSSPARKADRLGNCFTCNQAECFRNDPHTADEVCFGKTAFLVDAFWPEFDKLIQSMAGRADTLFLPVHGRRLKKANYAWSTHGFARVTTATMTTLHRSLVLHRTPRQGRALQSALLRFDRALARRSAAGLGYDVKHVVVSQNLLPHLWSEGALGGRTFDVLMTRLPMAEIHRRLDRAAAKYPDSATLGDFRVDPHLVELENKALKNAERLFTPHHEVAQCYPEKTVKLDWLLPEPVPPVSPLQSNSDEPGAILFPASALARKGLYELRDAMAGLSGDTELIVLGQAEECADPWNGCEARISPVSSGSIGAENPLDRARLVVLPAHIEHQPRQLLRAVSRGIPVIASKGCGLEGVQGVTSIGEPDAFRLRKAIEGILVQRP